MSLADQRDQVRGYAAEKGLVVLDVVEEAASGGVRDGEEFSWEHRPALLALMERAKAGEFDVLVVARLDRLSRDHPTLIVLERRLLRVGVRVLSVAEENGDGPVAEFIRGQLALVAQLERAMILTRVSAGKAKRRQEGRHLGGRAPFGYRLGTTGRFAVDEAEAVVVRDVFRRAREGLGPGPIARRLNAEGVRGPSGRPWSRQTVTNMLRNPVYYGELHSVPKAQPAIVSRRAWNAAQLD